MTPTDGMAVPEDTGLPTGRFEGRERYRELLRLAIREAASRKWPEMWFCDPDFQDWPLGERACSEALHAWSRAGGRLTVLAHRFDLVTRQHARFVAWRRLWDHRVACWGVPLAAVALPPGCLLGQGWLLRRLDAEHSRVVCTTESREVQAHRELWQDWLGRARMAFPASTLGL